MADNRNIWEMNRKILRLKDPALIIALSNSKVWTSLELFFSPITNKLSSSQLPTPSQLPTSLHQRRPRVKMATGDKYFKWRDEMLEKDRLLAEQKLEEKKKAEEQEKKAVAVSIT
jgi:hypothetical protein